jgi:hypothetical protein
MPEKNKIKVKKLLEKEVETILSKQQFKRIVCIADGARENWVYFRKKYPNPNESEEFFVFK